MYQIIIEHCFFGNGKFYNATINISATYTMAALERDMFIAANPNYRNHSIIIKEMKKCV